MNPQAPIPENFKVYLEVLMAIKDKEYLIDYLSEYNFNPTVHIADIGGRLDEIHSVVDEKAKEKTTNLEELQKTAQNMRNVEMIFDSNRKSFDALCANLRK